MKKIKFKKPFDGLDNTLKLIPESYMVEGKTFIMSDGKESLTIKWGNGKPTVLTSEGTDLQTETLNRLKHLMGFDSRKTSGILTGESRLTEETIFRNSLTEGTNLNMNQNEGFNGVDQQTGLTEEDEIETDLSQPMDTSVNPDAPMADPNITMDSGVEMPVPESNDSIVNNAIQILKDATAGQEGSDELIMALNNFQGQMGDNSNEFGDEMMGEPLEDGIPVYGDEERDIESYGTSDEFDVDGEDEINMEDLDGGSFDVDVEEEIQLDEDRSGKFVLDAINFFKSVYTDKYTPSSIKDLIRSTMSDYNVDNFKDLGMRISSKSIDELLQTLSKIYNG